MKKNYYLIISFCFFSFANGQIINFPDENFKAKLLAASPTNQVAKNLAGNYFKIDVNNDGEIQQTEALSVLELDISQSYIQSITGIINFGNLENLNCQNCLLSFIDGNQILNLRIFTCSGNQMILLDVSMLQSLEILNCSECSLNDININSLSNLVTLNLNNNNLNTLQLDGLINLTTLWFTSNQIANISLSNLLNLTEIRCDFNNLVVLDISNLNYLQKVYCSINHLTTLTFGNNINLQIIHCDNNNLTSLPADNLPSLIYLDCSYNQLSFLTFLNSNSLQRLESRNNQLTSVDLNNMGQLELVNFKNNQLLTSLFIKNGSNESLVVSFNNSLSFVCADDFQIGFIQSRVGQSCIVSDNCNLNSKEIKKNYYFNLYPDPAKNILYIDNEKNIIVSSISIYNIMGQVVQVITNPSKTIDVSDLKSGNYLVKIITDNGSSSVKFIKD